MARSPISSYIKLNTNGSLCWITRESPPRRYQAGSGCINSAITSTQAGNNKRDPHRNLVDFSHVPVVKRLTRMPVCVDPSHSVGSRQA